MNLNVYGTTYLNDNETEFLLDSGKGIEIIQYMSFNGMNTFDEHKSAIDGYIKKSQAVSMHGIGYDMNYSAFDPFIREVVKTRFQRTFEIAAYHGIDRIVFHSTGNKNEHRSETSIKWWIERCVAFWEDFYKYIPKDTVILIENVDDTVPAALCGMIKAINKANIRCCFDIGHAFISSDIPLTEWVDILRELIDHVHLHDNNGEQDDHLVLGAGKIPLKQVLSRLTGFISPDTPFVLECGKKSSLEWLCQNGFITS